MSVRMPRDLARLSRSGQQASNLSTIEIQALEESASSLGYQGRKAEKALAALKSSIGDKYKETLAEAAEAV